jgi:putative transposase
MHVHLVFLTKYRRKVFTAPALDALERIFGSICTDFDAKLEAFEGEHDHVHLLVTYPPKVAVARLVNSLKGVSSRRLRKEHPSLARQYWKGALWTPSYFAGSCGGAPLTVIRAYVESQQRPL